MAELFVIKRDGTRESLGRAVTVGIWTIEFGMDGDPESYRMFTGEEAWARKVRGLEERIAFLQNKINLGLEALGPPQTIKEFKS